MSTAIDVSVVLVAAVLWVVCWQASTMEVSKDLAPGRGCTVAMTGTLALILTVRVAVHAWQVTS